MFNRRTFDQFRVRLRSSGGPGWSAFGSAVNAAVYPSGLHADTRAALNSPRGLLLAIADVSSDPSAGQRLMERITKTYEEVPPDVDRLIALRATLDQATRTLKGLSKGADAPARAPMIISTVIGDQWYGINVGAIRCYHVHASGRIDTVRLEPTAQRKLEAEDSLLLCTPAVSEKLDEYDIALALYSNSPQSAVQRLLAMAKEKGAQGALAAVAFGPQRSLVTNIFGRSPNK